MTVLLSTITETDQRVLRRIARGDSRFTHSEGGGGYQTARELQRRLLLRVVLVEIDLDDQSEKAALTAVTFDLTERGREVLDEG